MEIEIIGTDNELLYKWKPPNTSEYPPLVHFPPSNNGTTIFFQFSIFNFLHKSYKAFKLSI
jgi:hypothetical protein